MKRTMRWLASFGVLALVVVLGLAFAACGSGGSDSSAANTNGDDALHVEDVADDTAPVEEVADEHEADEHEESTGSVDVLVDEWSITTDISSVPAGETLYVAANSGALPHEVVFLRTDRPVDDLPVGDDDKVNRFAEGIEDLGVIRTDDLVAGATVRKSFDLPAGNYALICNIPGHYRAGMFVAFTIQ